MLLLLHVVMLILVALHAPMPVMVVQYRTMRACGMPIEVTFSREEDARRWTAAEAMVDQLTEEVGVVYRHADELAPLARKLERAEREADRAAFILRRAIERKAAEDRERAAKML